MEEKKKEKETTGRHPESAVRQRKWTNSMYRMKERLKRKKP